MRSRLFLVLFGLVALAPSALADEPAKKKDDSGQVRDDITASEQQIARQFGEFEQSLLKLVQRLKRSEKREDQDRAKVLEKVLEESRSASITVQFERMVNALHNQKLNNPGELKNLSDQSQKIADDLRRLLALMREDPRAKQVQDDRKKLEQLIKDLDKIIHQQKNVQGITQLGRTDQKELQSNQNRVTEQTAKLVKDLERYNKKEGKEGEAKNVKGDTKDSGKEGGKAGEAKDAGKEAEAKRGEAKDAGKNAETAKSGAKGGQPKEAAGKENKGGEKSPSQAKETKAGEKSPSQAKAGAKASKSEQAQKGQPKSGEQSQQQGQAKSGEKNPSQSQAKSNGQSQQQQQEQEAKQKGDGQEEQQKPPSQQQPQDDIAQAKKRIQDGNYHQKRAEDEIKKNNNPEASKKQNDAVAELEKAKKELEKLLRQMREEELERLLAALQARCEKMLAMQIQVLTGTEGTHKSILNNLDKLPKHENKQESLRLSDQEKEIVGEANKAIETLEAEGSAVAFPEVFQQVREDMKHVQRRLEVTDVAQVTQTIERDIIETLKEMIEALKKARQELDNKQSKSNNSSSGPPPDQKLLDQLAELKMIRSLQIRVNARTQVYGKQYEAKEGEQTADPNLRRELNNLAERQERIFEITNKIAKGDNR
jgi:hypothetical protein